MFLRATYMPRMAEKLKKEMKPGTLIISSTFRLPADWPVTDRVSFHAPFKTEIFIYRTP
jgi:hypothetical protein